MKSWFFIFIIFIAGCVAMPTLDIPDYAKISDDHRTLVAETTNIGKQSVYKDQELIHYILNGQDIYCTDLVSMDMDKYRCFTIDAGYLVAGMHPLSYEIEPLQNKVPVRIAPK